jgi:hypothetical protein
MFNTLAMKGIEIKTILRFHFTPVRLALIKKTKREMLLRMQGKGTIIHCLWECTLVQSLWKLVWRYLKKLKMGLPYDPSIPLLGIYLKDYKWICKRDTCTPMFTAAVFRITEVSNNQWMNNENMAYHGILLNHKE